MIQTKSECTVTLINESVFYREFTFDKNKFYPEDGAKELADNVMMLDDLLFIIQVKERSLDRFTESTDKWFANKVLKDAKKQIGSTLKYLNKYDQISIKNRQDQTIAIPNVNITKINKIIIYEANETLKDEYVLMKFYESGVSGSIHLFNIEDYNYICKYLITPTELDEYLKFRERIYLNDKEKLKPFSEKYILCHFFNTAEDLCIKEEYLDTLSRLVEDTERFDVAFFLNNFFNKMYVEEQKEAMDYHTILKEIVSLKRYELLEFKKRFKQIFEDIKYKRFSMPYRFASYRLNCGFVFIPLLDDKVECWQNILQNSMEKFKYKYSTPISQTTFSNI